MQTLVTGGAGFIGSHLSARLLSERHLVVVLDNLSNGNEELIPEKAEFIKKDLVSDDVTKHFRGIEAVFHFAADPDVRTSVGNPKSTFENNVVATYNVLEACRKNDIARLIFASTSAVYGEAKAIPTPESYLPLPISNYGASKLACEAYCSSYANSYGIQITVLRFANIYGAHSTHGVMHDFFHKLNENPKQLEILGNGKQEKSYLHVSDAVAATILAFEKQKTVYEIFNVGSTAKTTVTAIAEQMATSLKLSPKLTYAGGDRGWVGDVPLMLLDVKKLQALGWGESTKLQSGIKAYVSWLGGFKV